MIISYKHKFIFIHCRKVAGTSIAALLSACLGPDDLQVGTWASSYRNGVLPNRRFFLDLLNWPAFAEFTKKLAEKPGRILNFQSLIHLLNMIHTDRYTEYFSSSPCHPTAEELRSFDGEAWDSFYKFCFVRNPYERAVSDFIFINRIRKTEIGFMDFLLSLDAQRREGKIFKEDYDNWPMYTINDAIAVDFIGRYESLEDDLGKALDNIGIQNNETTLPKLNFSLESYNYKDYFKSEEELLLVEKLYDKEIQHFNYRLG